MVKRKVVINNSQTVSPSKKTVALTTTTHGGKKNTKTHRVDISTIRKTPMKVSTANKKKADKGDDTTVKIKKPYRFRPGTVAAREIRKIQKSVEFQVPKASVRRVIQEILNNRGDFRMTEKAKLAIQVSVEEYATDLMKSAYIITEEADRRPKATLTVRHIRAANNVALHFPGKAIDNSFKDRIHVAPLPRTERKVRDATVNTSDKRKDKTKTTTAPQTQSPSKKNGRDSRIVSKKNKKSDNSQQKEQSDEDTTSHTISPSASRKKPVDKRSINHDTPLFGNDS